MRGKGIWLRKFTDIAPEEAAAALDFVVVPGHTRRGRSNRSAAALDWIRRFKAAGGRVWVMDWLPTPDMGTGHLPELAEWSSSIGADGIMADLEPDAGWRQAQAAAERYALALHSAADQRGLGTAYTDYGRGGNSRGVMETLLSILDFGVPQSYDPNGEYTDNYHTRSADYWKERGAKKLVIGLGGWLRGERRHRTEAEFLRHLQSGLPNDTRAVIVWYAPPRGDVPSQSLARILSVLKPFVIPGDTVSLLDALTPFGAAFREWLG